MKLPDPVAYHFKDDPVRWALPGEGFCFKAALPSDAINVMPLYSEAQVKELLAQADRDASDLMLIVHMKQTAKYEPVLKVALDALDQAAYIDCAMSAASKAIQEVLG